MSQPKLQSINVLPRYLLRHSYRALGLSGFQGRSPWLAFPLPAFLPLGALLLAAPFFEEAFSGATCAPCAATAAVLSLIVTSAFVMVVNPFCAWLAHDDSSLWWDGNARE